MAKEATKETKKTTPASGESAGQSGGGAKKASPLKVVMLLGLVLVLEGGTVFVTMFLNKGPNNVNAKPPVSPEELEASKPVELLVAKEQFDNQHGNRIMIYDTEIYITVANGEKGKNKDRIQKQIDAMQAQISTDLATVFRKAEPTHFLEPARATLTRQVKAALDERLGKDTNGKSVVLDAFIRKCIGFQAG